jgi:hypothetical protein
MCHRSNAFFSHHKPQISDQENKLERYLIFLYNLML